MPSCNRWDDGCDPETQNDTTEKNDLDSEIESEEMVSEIRGDEEPEPSSEVSWGDSFKSGWR